MLCFYIINAEKIDEEKRMTTEYTKEKWI